MAAMPERVRPARSLRLAAALCMVLCIGCLHKPKDDLFPATPGSAWTYSAHFTGSAGGRKIDQTGTLVTTAISVERSRAGRTVVTRTELDGKPLGEETTTVTDSEIARSRFGAGGANVFTPPLPLIKTPAHPGMRWSWAGTVKLDSGGAIPARADGWIVAHERLDTKAGRFDCFRVEVHVTGTSAAEKLNLPSIYWFRRDVGLVREQTTVRLPSGEAATMDAELTSFRIK